MNLSDEWNRLRIAFDLLHTWTCADGRVMTVAEMDTNHIRNAVNKIRFKTENWRTEFLDRLELEILYRNNTEKKKVSGKHTREQRDAENARRRELRAQLRASAKKAPRESFAKKTNAARRIKGVDPERKPTPKLLPATMNRNKEAHEYQVALSKKAPAIQQGAPREHTMARSYVRTTGAGQGKLRSGTYQTTVSFTPPQMAQLIEAAGFRCVSLAEMIRSCVVDHLNKKLPQT